MEDKAKLAILVGGGPAPGINSVIGAATIRACLSGIPVLGVRDGFQWIMRGELAHARPLDIEAVSRIHFRGGSCLAGGGESTAAHTHAERVARRRRFRIAPAGSLRSCICRASPSLL